MSRLILILLLCLGCATPPRQAIRAWQWEDPKEVLMECDSNSCWINGPQRTLGLVTTASLPTPLYAYLCDNEAFPWLDQYPNDKNVCTPVLGQVRAGQ